MRPALRQPPLQRRFFRARGRLWIHPPVSSISGRAAPTPATQSCTASPTEGWVNSRQLVGGASPGPSPSQERTASAEAQPPAGSRVGAGGPEGRGVPGAAVGCNRACVKRDAGWARMLDAARQGPAGDTASALTGGRILGSKRAQLGIREPAQQHCSRGWERGGRLGGRGGTNAASVPGARLLAVRAGRASSDRLNAWQVGPACANLGSAARAGARTRNSSERRPGPASARLAHLRHPGAPPPTGQAPQGPRPARQTGRDRNSRPPAFLRGRGRREAAALREMHARHGSAAGLVCWLGSASRPSLQPGAHQAAAAPGTAAPALLAGLHLGPCVPAVGGKSSRLCCDVL